MTVLEKEIEAKLVKMVKQTGGWCLKWVCPGWSGVPDRIVLLPGAKVIFVETKRPKGGRVSRLQEKWGEILTGLGFLWFVIWNEEDLEMFRGLLAKQTGGRGVVK